MDERGVRGDKGKTCWFSLLRILVGAIVLVALLPQGQMSAQRGQQVVNVPFVAKPPTIDGTLEEGEWTQAARLQLKARQGDANCIFYLANDAGRLYIAVDAVDDRTHSSLRGPGRFDNMAAWFRSNGTWVGFWLYGDSTLRTERLPNFARYPSGAFGRAKGPPEVSHMIFELSIPLQELGITPGESVRAGLHYWDSYPQGPSFWWPPNVGVDLPERYAQLVLSLKP